MNYTFWISTRYLTARNKESFISLISTISVLGVAIGVMALIVVLAVMTGFDNDLKDKIIGTNAHILIEKADGINDYPRIKETLSKIKGVANSAPYVNGRLFLLEGNRFLTLAVRGINSAEEQNVTKIKEYMVAGSLNLSGNDVLIGRELSNYLGLGVGETISLVYPTQKAAHQFKVRGIFNSGMYDYDMNLIFVDIKEAQNIFGLKDVITGVALKLEDIYKADTVKGEIFKNLGFSYITRTWMEVNRNFFAALRLEKVTMFIILTLIVLVASFNIISTLIVIVTSKVKDIGILKSIGVSSRGIKKIFTLEGLAIGISGTFLGVVSGVALCLLLKKYQFIQLPQEIYYINRLPVSLQWQDIGVIVAAAILISFLSTIYPASKAAKLNPVEALRYE